MARNLGFSTKEELLESMTAKQAQQWETFGMIEPFPEDKIVQAIAHVAAIFANGTLKKKSGQGWSPKDFTIQYFTPPVKKKKPQTLKTMKAMLMAIGDAFGKKGPKNKPVKPLNPHRIKYEAEKYIPKRFTPPANPVKRRKK